MLMTLVAQVEERATLFLPNWAFPLIGALAFLFMAFVSWNFRNVANRHSDKTGGAARSDQSEHGGGGHH